MNMQKLAKWITKLLWQHMVLSLGINISCIFNERIYWSPQEFQTKETIIGRGIRKAEDKDYWKVIDLTSNLKYSKRHLTKRKQFYKEQQFRHCN